ncbi:type VI secretion system Vgr family protein [Salmonella enterica]|nr:type VI secretion system Vgr family protein [Salmonella enterica]
MRSIGFRLGLYRGKRQEEHIKLATEYGKTQLNMGYLVNSQREKRGAGFELRTDSLSSPFSIEAGDPIGHMGYYQAPKDGGYEARYQVHIECTSMDDNLEKFLTNPERVGEKNPLWLKYAPGLVLYKKDITAGTFTKDTRVTTRSGILPLSQVQTEADKSTRQEYWQLRPENAYVPKGQAEPQLLSQYDLAKLGFRTETAEPASFDYLDGKNQPVGFFRNLINSLYEAATGDTRTSHALVKHNYQRLLDKIDSGSHRYSPMEYWRALHNPDYRDVIQKTIVKHPSDWYFKKGDALWQPFLNALKKDAPEWKKYSEDFLDKMAWMQDVTTEKLGPTLWHMHPIMFLGAMINIKKRHSGLFTVQDGKDALRKIYDKYGKDMSVIVERMFRIETTHFTSGQYQHCGAPGMEVHGAPPAYGWSSDFFSQHPEYQPTGIWSKKEGRGLSGQGGNAQVTDKPKQFVVFDSVESSMEYIVYYINKHGGNYARWYSTQDSAQKLYREECGAIKPKFTNEFSEVKS